MTNVKKTFYIDKKIFFNLAFFLILSNLFACWYVRQEHFIYYMDQVNYWQKLDNISNNFLKNPFDAFRHLVYSIREDDYNDLPAFLLMPFKFLFGISRLSFILAIINVFALPVIITFIFLHKKLNSLEGLDIKNVSLVPIAVVLLFPNFWQPILAGYLDVGGVILINLVLLMYLDRPYLEQKSSKLFLMAGGITGLILFRRWYAYWGVAFYAALFLKECLSLFLNNSFNVKDLGRIIVRLLAQVSISGLLLFTIAPTFAHRILITDYSDIYSAFRSDRTMLQAFIELIFRFGLLYFSLFILGVFNGFKNRTTREFSFLLLAQWLIIFILFARTQDFGRHQLYLLMPTMLIFTFLFLTRLFAQFARTRIFLICGLLLLSILNFMTGFTDKEFWLTKTFPCVFTDFHQAPCVRNDINVIDRILRTIEKLAVKKDDRVYVLAASDALNCQTLNRAYLSLGRHKNIAGKIAWTNDIDKRDGFPEELLNATYVIVANPIQYGADPQYERILGVPAGLFLKQTGIAASFIKLPYEFVLQDNVKVYIYQKIKPLDEQDILALSEMLKSYYPDRKDIYEIKRR